VPTLAELGYDPAAHTTPFKGGETGEWVCAVLRTPPLDRPVREFTLRTTALRSSWRR